MSKNSSHIEEMLADYRAGKFVVVVDDDNRENEGDLAVAAEHITPEAVNFMATCGRGLICLAMAGEMLDRLQIPLMVPQVQNRSGFGTSFTISVDAKAGITTGISAYDRAHTIHTLIDPAANPDDIVMPGHIFPLRAQDGGVLVRRGQTEACVDLAKLSGLAPAGVICEIMAEDGTMMRLKGLNAFAKRHAIKIVTVEEIAQYRLRRIGHAPAKQRPIIDRIARTATSRLPTQHGEFLATVYRDEQGQEHIALARGDLKATKAPLVRLHSECLTGDVFGSLRCDCGDQLQAALARITAEGCGLLLYLRQEGRGIGLENKIRAYELQDQGLDTVEANHQLGFPTDARSYGVAASILEDLGVTAVRLLTNNPDKVSGLEERGIHVEERVPHQVAVCCENRAYLQTKALKMGHQLSVPTA
ncbi:MAG: GTP cyclohydrolase II, partial [Anaerolineae bacterium]|nr:GTP cyclohydrolase II [Anaerolineae bacterium]